MAIQMRRGLRADFDPYKMLPGEWAVSIDASTSNQIVWMCFEPGVCKRMGTYEDFVEQVKEATADVKTEYVEEFDKILDEIKVLSSQVSDDKDTVVLVKTTIEDEYLPQIQEALSEIQGKVSESKNSADAAAVSAENAKKSEVNAKTYAEQAKTASGEQVALNRQTLGYSKKNLLKNTATTKTANGITFTVNEDGSISVKGTATAANYAFTVGKFKPMPNKTYIFTANSEVPGGNSSLGNNYCFIYNIDGVPAWKSDVFASDGTHVPYEFTPTTDTEITCQIYVAKGTTVENLTFYPMIRSAEITDGTYEPYVDDVDTRLQKIDDSILNTLEEIDANTSEGNIAGALAIKSLNSKVSDLTNNSGYYLGTTGSLTLGADETITIPDLTDYKFLLFVFNGTYVAEFVPLLELHFAPTDKFSRKTVQDGYYFNLKVILVEGGINIKIEEIAGYSYGAVAIYGLK